MKVALHIARFLRDAGIKHVFGISGGASLHLLHAIAETEGIDFVCNQNEQACSFAADAYARIRGVGAALATSGPGATSLITGIAASFYDSVPVLYITGNQTVERLNTHGTRQYGFQATPIASLCKEITKVAWTLTEPKDVIHDMTEALRIAQSGRKGPVLIDLPDDLQRAMI